MEALQLLLVALTVSALSPQLRRAFPEEPQPFLSVGIFPKVKISFPALRSVLELRGGAGCPLPRHRRGGFRPAATASCHHAASRARSQPGGFALVGHIHGVSSSSAVSRSEHSGRGAVGEPKGTALTESSAHSHETPSLYLQEGNTEKRISHTVTRLWHTWSQTTPQQR